MNSERVMGIVPRLSTGLFGQNSYTLVVTNYRLIFAEVTNQLLNQERERAVSSVQNEGMMTKWKASMSSHSDFHNRYYKIPPQSILQESPNNYELRPGQVNSVKIKTGFHSQEYTQRGTSKMIIKSSIGKKKFTFDQMNPKDVKHLLGQLLGPRI
ncbi:MAG: hypothetical protein R6W73_01125 [Candidatus Saliniplasma sp.]